MRRPYLSRLCTIALLVFVLAVPGLARAEFLVGYLAQCTAVAAGSCTEPSAPSYARQLITFSNAISGATTNSMPFTFGPGGTLAGRAVFDAPTGGNLVAVLPFAAPQLIGTPDQGDVGTIRLSVTALANYPDAALFTGILPAASALGTMADGSSATVGVAAVIRAGLLQAATPAFDATYAYRAGLATGFSIANLTNTGTLILNASATLASGSVTFPSAPVDGQQFRILCGITVTALTMTPASGQAQVGSVSTCGPTAGHEWSYVGGVTKTWFLRS